MTFIVVSTLCAGALASLSAKTLYQMQTIGLCSASAAAPFEKPAFITMSMFVGEACCLAGFYLFVKPKQRREAVQPSAPLSAPLLDDDVAPFPAPSSTSTSTLPSTSSDTGTSKESLPPCPTWFFIALCSFDLTASMLNYVGLIWVSASLNQVRAVAGAGGQPPASCQRAICDDG